jgi:Domain of unknown function (DUF4276)
LELLCRAAGAQVDVRPIDPFLLGPAGRTVHGRLKFLLDNSVTFDVVFVHRDAENEPAELRRREIVDGANAAGIRGPVVPIVPVRMTEAWLLRDEAAIRQVAAKPSGRTSLNLPSVSEAERLADPKRALADALLAASEMSGRRRSQMSRDFGRHRRLLLERLDPHGEVTQFSAWRQMQNDIATALSTLSEM